MVRDAGIGVRRMVGMAVVTKEFFSAHRHKNFDDLHDGAVTTVRAARCHTETAVTAAEGTSRQIHTHLPSPIGVPVHTCLAVLRHHDARNMYENVPIRRVPSKPTKLVSCWWRNGESKIRASERASPRMCVGAGEKEGGERAPSRAGASMQSPLYRSHLVCVGEDDPGVTVAEVVVRTVQPDQPLPSSGDPCPMLPLPNPQATSRFAGSQLSERLG